MLPADDELKNTGAARGAPSAARRRLLRGGLATGPVLMTIASRPVMGQVVCTASASVSIVPVASLNNARAQSCEEAAGLSPERWKAMAPDWPAPYVAVIAATQPAPTDAACAPNTAPTPTSTQTTTAPSAYDAYRTRRAELYASRGLTSGSTTTTTVVPTTTAAPTTSTTCTPTVAPTPTQTTTAPSAYDAYRARRTELYASRGLTTTTATPTSLSAPATTTTTYTAPQTTTYAAPSTYSTATATQTATTSSTSTYTYRTRPGQRDPFFSGTTTVATAPAPTTVAPVTTTATPLVGPAGTNGTPFHGPTTGLGGQAFGTQTMLEVLDASGGAYAALGRYTVAALLNAKSGRVHVLPESTVRNMWNDCVTRGYFEPTAGVRWSAAEVVAYMQRTIA